jgi:HmuY protein
MPRIISVLIFLMVAIMAIGIQSCSDDDPTPIPVVSVTFEDLDADYAPFEPVVGPPTGPPKRIGETKEYTFFSFKTGQIVANGDSATANWDIAFRSTSIIINSGTSGPGTTTAQVVQGVFDEIDEAPESGYLSDNVAAAPPAFVVSASPLIPGMLATNQWWQNGGTATSTIVTPIAGQVIVVKTGDNRYAKLEILSYYKGAPATPNNTTDQDRHYTFRYVYQPNDSRKFE